MENEIPTILSPLKRKLASVFFPSAESIKEDKFLQKYCIILEEKFQDKTVALHLAALNKIKDDKITHGLDEIYFSELGSDFQTFMDLFRLYGSRRSLLDNMIGSALSHMGYFLFPNLKAMEIFDDLMKNEFKNSQKSTNLLATMWDMELFLRDEKSKNGIEALRDWGIEEGREHIDQFVLKYQKTLERVFKIGVLKDGLMRCIFSGYQGEKVKQDIENLRKFIKRKSKIASASVAVSHYGKSLDELQEKLGSFGWTDGNLGEFLDLRKTLVDRNGDINPKNEPSMNGSTFFNLLTISAQQRYPALQRFIPLGFVKNPANATKLTYVVLDFLTHLRDKRREKDADIDAFPEDVNEESIDEFLKNYRVPNGVAEEALKKILSKFAELPSIDKIQPGIYLDILDKAEYQGTKVEQDIKDLKEFIISKSKDKPQNALMPYKNLFDELQKKIGKSGWPVGFVEFLDLRGEILLDRNKTINPMKDEDNPVTSFFNLLTVAAQQRYPALRQFIISKLNIQNNQNITLYTYLIMNFLTRLREKRRETGNDINAFHEDVNEESIDEFLQNEKNSVSRSVAKNKFKLLMLEFPKSFFTESQTEFLAVPA